MHQRVSRSTDSSSAAAADHARDVAVLLLPPVHHRGIVALLQEEGFAPVVPADPVDWARRRPSPPLLVLADTGPALQLASAVAAARPDAVSLALVERATAARYREVLAVCTGAVPMSCELGAISAALHAAVHGLLALPVGDGRALLTTRPAPETVPELAPRERAWLRALSDRATVAGLGPAYGYSEREMYRLLAGVYARLGTANRTQALLRAQEWGLLDPPEG